MQRDSLVAQMVKSLPAMQKTQVQSLGWENPLERKWQPTPICLPGEFPGQRSLVGYSARGHKEQDMTEWLTLLLSKACTYGPSAEPAMGCWVPP